MRIAIEARALSATAGGVKTYVHELLKGLAGQAPQHTYTLLENPRSSLFVPAWLDQSVPRQLEKLQPDIVHFTKAALPRKKQFPTVVTIYDLIPMLFPKGQTFLRRQYWPRTLKHAAVASDHILTISEASKRDIMREFSVNPDKITVTPLAADLNHFQPRPKETTSKPYILYLGQLEPRKNIPLLVRAFARISDQVPHRLLLAGKPYWRTHDISNAIACAHLEGRVQIMHTVPYEDLPALYSNADLFVWPSIYEGWGLPPLEAMACGTPVLVSNGGALPEVVGDAGEVVPFTISDVPGRTKDVEFEKILADRMLALLSNKNTLAQMSERGLQQAQKFSWNDVARKTLEVYNTVL